MNEITIFKNEEFGSIRTLMINGEPYFVGKDVAEVLGYASPRATISKKVDSEDKGVAKMETPRGVQDMTVINESGVYALIFGSKLPSAKKFKHWVTSEVLPSIRKTGSYSVSADKTPSYLIEDGIERAKAWIKEQEQMKLLSAKNEEQQKRIEEMKPKEIFTDAVCDTKSDILVGTLAKLLNQNGIDIGQNRLFKWLRDNNYLMSVKGENWNMPTQKAMDMELFRVVTRCVTNSDGEALMTTRTTKVTPKGQVYFINEFLKEKITK